MIESTFAPLALALFLAPPPVGAPLASRVVVKQSVCQTIADKLGPTERAALLASTRDKGEAIPRNVKPYMDWRMHGRVGAGNAPGTFSAFVPWGQIFAADGQQRYVEATVEIRGLEAYLLSKRTRRWRLIVSTDKLSGAQFGSNFEGNVSTPAQIDTREHVSRVTLNPSSAFHFWPQSGRVTIDPMDVGAIVVSFEARAGRPGMRDTEYIASAGGDYWSSTGGEWDRYKTNKDVGIGRFIYIGDLWRKAFMSTATAADLKHCID